MKKQSRKTVYDYVYMQALRGFVLISVVATSTGSALLLVNPAKAELLQVRHTPSVVPTSPIQSIIEKKQLSTSAQDLLVQSPTPSTPTQTSQQKQPQLAAVVSVTQVRVVQTQNGVDVILVTNQSETLKPEARREGNKLIADLPNAQLQLPSGGTFRQEKPGKGIASIQVTNTNANTIRVTVTGETDVPTVELFDSNEGLVFGVTPTASTGIQPTQQKPTSGSGGNQDPIEIVVTGKPEGSYRVPKTSVGTKTPTDRLDIPANTQVVPRAVLDDQADFRINDALRNVGGYQVSSTAGGRQETPTVQGFGATFFKDGFRDNLNTTRALRETANLEQIEVLKGPASVLYGQGEPGAIINLVTKKPLRDPYYAAEFTAGSYDFYRPTLDFSFPLSKDGNSGFRINSAYENAGSFRDGVHTERSFIAPAIAVQISPRTKLTLEGEYLDATFPLDSGLPVLGSSIANVPISRFYGDPRFVTHVGQKQVTSFLEHQFNQDLSLKSSFRYTSAFEDYPNGRIFGSSLLPKNQVQILDSKGTQYYETYTWQNDLIAKFKTGSVSHTVLLGLEVARRTLDNKEVRAFGSTDLFNPTREFSFGQFKPSIELIDRTNTFWIYLEDQMTLLENLKLVLGGRFDTYDDNYLDRLRTPITTDANAFSPRAGLVYQPSKEVSLYANYSRSFVPQLGSSFNGSPFDPTRGTGYEVGVKTDFFNGRLSSTLAFYQITKTNVLTTDPNHRTYFIEVGEQRSRGINLDIAGEILPGWKIIASYAYTDAVIAADNSYPVGNRINSIPLHSGSLWTTYTLGNGSLKGLGFGAGIIAASNSFGDLNNSYIKPSYIRTDAAVYYNRGNFKAALNFKNLFDVRYFQDDTIPDPPLTVLGRISVQF